MLTREEFDEQKRALLAAATGSPPRSAPMGSQARPAPRGGVSDQETALADDAATPSPAVQQLGPDAPGPGLAEPQAGEGLQPGDRLGPFVLVSELGRGTFGSVWRVEDSQVGNHCALKLVSSAFADPRLAQKTLIQEFAVLARIRDMSHVVRIERPRVERHRGSEFLVLPMELAEGGTLRDWMLAHPLPRTGGSDDERLAEALQLFRQACRGVQSVHAAGAVHLDLKPQNLLLCGDTLKVADFGLSRDLTRVSAGASQLLADGVGTPAYMAPEQFTAARPKDVGPQADVWALGVILFELLDGEVPFQARSPAALERKVRDAALKPSLRGIPPAFHELLLDALHPAEEQRLRDVEALLARLDRLADEAREAPSEASQRPGTRAAAAEVQAAATPTPDQGTSRSLTLSITVDGRDAGKREFDDSRPVTIGKRDINRLQIEDPALAQVHAGISWDDDGSLTLVDLCSSSGTLLNGAPLPPGIVGRPKDGDEIRVGNTVLLLNITRPGQASEENRDLVLVRLPELEEGGAGIAGEIVAWLVSVGDTVVEGQPLVEVMTDKATIEVPSSGSGRVRSLEGEVEDIIEEGVLLAVLEKPTAHEAFAREHPVGSRVSGVVSNILEFGIFVRLTPEIDGLVHRSDLSWEDEVQQPSELFSKGDRVEAVVLKIDAEKERVGLGIKQLSARPSAPKKQAPRVVVHRPEQPVETVPFTGDVMGFGRGRSNEVQIKNDGKISRYHCRIFRAGDQFIVEDNKSANGTLVDGLLVTRQVLAHGETITIGNTKLQFLLH